MKKIVLFSLANLLLFNVFAQDDKFDIDLGRKIISKSNLVNLATVPVIAKGDVNAMRTLTLSLGGRVKYSSGNLIAIELPYNKLSDFASSQAVIRMESRTPRMFLLNDTMRVNNNINEIHLGLPPLAQGYDGSGVVTGFVDSGIDFSHPDFKDSSGNSRIAWIWDHTKPVGPNTPSPYGYGQEWSNTDIDAGLAASHTADNAHYGHGSNSAGITSGNGLATGFNQGCAPKADIIMVAYDFNTQQPNRIADAINYIFDKANAMGKPCVINLSLGDIYGSHDGKDLEAQMIDNLLHAQTGRLIISAHGNWGADDKRHLSYTVTSDTSWTWFKYDPAFGQVYIEMYGDSADFLNLDFAIGVDADITSSSFLGHSNFRKITSIANMPFATTELIPGATGDTIIYQKTKVNGVYQLNINIFTGTPSRYFRLMTKGSGKFDLRNVLFQGGLPSGMVYTNLPPDSIVPDIVHYKLPDSLVTNASSFNCLDDVVSVAYSWNRNSNYDCQDSLRFNTTFAPGSLVVTSSLGPTRDGRQKPDITASGNYVMTAIPLIFANDPVWQTYPKMNKGCFHYTGGGSSCAAPIVAGIGALYLQKFPNATPAQFKNDIICGAKTDTFTGTNLPDYSWGYGKVNGFKTINQCFAGIEDLNNQQVFVSVQPNPFSSSTTLHVYSLKNIFSHLSLKIYDILGKCITTIPATAFVIQGNEAIVQVQRNELNSGIYFFVIENNNQVISTGKLIVE